MVSKGRILVVEDDFDISNMLRIYFSGQGYDVQLKTEMGQKVDADITATALELSQGNIQLQAAFQMQSKMPHTSLFDFMG